MPAMNYEIEIKAHVKRPERVIEALDGMAEFLRSYDKSDSYFLLSGAEPGQGRNFRVRTEDGASVVTWKNRSFKDETEVNIEREFEVGDAAAFIELCLSMGATPYIKKRKIGRAYGYQGMTVEVSEVPPLGFFVEIEQLVEIEPGSPSVGDGRGPGEGLPMAPDPELVRSITARQRELLTRLGIPDGDIEARPYSLMLRKAAGLA
jgi:predicted adenylyl cyclase CyaB